MNEQPLGDSGLRTTRFGLGLAALGRPGYINLGHAADLRADYEVAAMEGLARDVLDAAWDAGVRYFDAARSYGRAEEFLGQWLRSRSPSACTIGSKWGYIYTANWQIEAEGHERKEHSLPVLRRQIGESRDHLGDLLSLYQIHSATPESGVLQNDAVLRQLAELQSDGLHIGLSVSGPGQSEMIRQAIDICVNGRRLFDTVQATWNLLEQSAGPALLEAHQAGLGVIVKEGLAHGRLTERNEDPTFAEIRRKLRQATKFPAAAMDQLALAAVLNQSWTGTVLSGAATAAQLQSNVAALALPWPDNAEEWLADFSETPAGYWSKRAGLKWN